MTIKPTPSQISQVMSELGKRNKGKPKRRPDGYYSMIAKLKRKGTK